ncbi:hypothetical protein UPYG_G00060680 [Umbra pygmaea]|uniref:Immunoglobulin domain-containing protein n=1 Tax=Umbra pygmaea TaxID=75934 RepID=A0ABD0X9I2_UMBPY
MKILHVVSCCLLSALCIEASATNKVEVVGGDVLFPCSYTWAEGNNKYFCKDPCSDKDILVQTKGSKNVTQGRYNIHDDVQNRVFFVTIKDLQKTDSGTYWCRVDRSIKDTYTDLYLTVNDAPKSTSRPDVSTTLPNLFATSFNNTTTKSNLSATSSNSPKTKSNLSATSQHLFTVSMTSEGFFNSTRSRAVPSLDTSATDLINQLVWVSVGLVVMVTLLLLVLLLFYRQRKKSNRPTPRPVFCNTNTAPSGETDCLYEEIKEASAPTDNLPLTMTSVNSTADDQAPTVYSSVNLPYNSSSLSVDSGTQVNSIYSTAESPQIL